jgi:hypothetical protein
LNDFRIIPDHKFVSFPVTEFQLLLPIKLPGGSVYLFEVLTKQLKNVGVENIARNRILNGIGQLVDFNVNLYFLLYCHLPKVQNVCQTNVPNNDKSFK